MKQLIAPLVRRVANLLSRGVVTFSDASKKQQILQISLLAEEAKDNIEHFEPFGYTSRPLPGSEVLAAFIEGDRSHGIVIMATDRRYRVINLNPGENALFNAYGMTVQLAETGIQVNGGGQPISITNAPAVNLTDCNINITGGDVNADGISLKQHIHGSVQAGSDNSGPPFG